MTLKEYIEKSKDNDNVYWTLDSGTVQNLLDEAIEKIAELQGQRDKATMDAIMRICPACGDDMRGDNHDVCYRCKIAELEGQVEGMKCIKKKSGEYICKVDSGLCGCRHAQRKESNEMLHL